MSAPTNDAAAPRQATKVVRRPRALLRGVDGPLVQAGEMTRLALEVLWMAIRRPWGYWAEVRDQSFDILKLCWIPMAVSCTAFGLGAPGLQGGNLFSLFGIPERLGSFFVMASIREFAPWVNAMVVAGVVGTAITADLGARRIREEIDAMEVLGVDPVRTLVLPRVIALFIMTGLLDLVALMFGILGGYIAAVPILGANPAAFVDSLFNNLTTTDVWGSVIKTALFGLIIGVVCCYKGLHASGGPIGVGRAVNQAVVIAFAAIWIFNMVFTTILLGLNPDIQVYR
ncbi:MlaE family ABC transporter permease [Pseudonocardia bannensis]|uniref:ABC transporter permease n=1 Tax=Pseudonocardia bannensis TaxID=630973 RepID=A0A848DCA3_9PSEU|nr:ABC transporter permease [Pseudonocardia bannensis]NMH90246.1 ABC transporter permease [Pseudonocardia bannensis]